jgi:hypothetical protein
MRSNATIHISGSSAARKLWIVLMCKAYPSTAQISAVEGLCQAQIEHLKNEREMRKPRNYLVDASAQAADVTGFGVARGAKRNREGADLCMQDRSRGLIAEVSGGSGAGSNEGENEYADDILHGIGLLCGSKVVICPIALDRTYGVNIVQCRG